MTNTDKRCALGVAVSFLVLLGWAAVSSADLADAEQAHRIHCEAVAQWQADARAGVEPAQRRGWPNYDGRACE